MPNSLLGIYCEEKATGRMAARFLKARDLWEFFADVLEEVKAKGRVVVLGGAEAVAGAGLEAIKIL